MRPAVVNSPAKPCSGACNLLRSLARGPQPRCVLAQALPLPAPRAWRRWPGLEHTHGPHIAAAAAQTAEVEGEVATPLEQFLGWCLANGAEGVGREGSKAAIFEGQHGERGLVCLQVRQAGQQLGAACFPHTCSFSWLSASRARTNIGTQRSNPAPRPVPPRNVTTGH